MKHWKIYLMSILYFVTIKKIVSVQFFSIVSHKNVFPNYFRPSNLIKKFGYVTKKLTAHQWHHFFASKM